MENLNKISKYFNLPQLGQSARDKAFAKEDALYKNTKPLHNSRYIFGIEVEVEGITKNDPRGNYADYWTATTDNSLRNNGVEFVSAPLRADQLEGAFAQLKQSINTNHNFSPRTSVHVHMNVRDMTINQINNLLIVYAVVEDLLFNYAGESRKNNVFCIRLQDTNYIDNMRLFQNDPTEAVHRWNKYTALNLHPIADKGTVEFRHMRGTLDVDVLLTWVNLLSCIKTFAKDNTTSQIFQQVMMLNAESNYEMFLYRVFGDYTKHLSLECNLHEQMKDAISYIKLINWKTEATQQRVALDDLINAVAITTPQPNRIHRQADPQVTAWPQGHDAVQVNVTQGTGRVPPTLRQIRTRQQQFEAEQQARRGATRIENNAAFNTLVRPTRNNF